MSKFVVGKDGIRRCKSRRIKICYDSIDDAWRASLIIFIESGFILTPYRCGRSKRWAAVVRSRMNGNPWGWKPGMRIWVALEPVRQSGCGEWHLTSRTNYVLAGEKGMAIPTLRTHRIYG